MTIRIDKKTQEELEGMRQHFSSTMYGNLDFPLNAIITMLMKMGEKEFVRKFGKYKPKKRIKKVRKKIKTDLKGTVEARMARG